MADTRENRLTAPEVTDKKATENSLRQFMAYAEENALEMMAHEGEIATHALIAHGDKVTYMPMPAANIEQMAANAKKLRCMAHNVRADAVVFVTEAAINTTTTPANGKPKSRRKDCVLIAGVTREVELVKTLNFTRDKQDIVFEKDPGIQEIRKRPFAGSHMLTSIWR